MDSNDSPYVDEQVDKKGANDHARLAAGIFHLFYFMTVSVFLYLNIGDYF